MAEYIEIESWEMRDFLETQGYNPVSLPRTRELVYEKVITSEPLAWRTVVRVYTTVEAGKGRARDVGKDSIKVVPLLILAEPIYKNRTEYPLGKNKRVHRVRNWKANLQSRLDATEALPQIKSPPTSPQGYPMVIRKGNRGEFWASLGFPKERFTLPFVE